MEAPLPLSLGEGEEGPTGCPARFVGEGDSRREGPWAAGGLRGGPAPGRGLKAGSCPETQLLPERSGSPEREPAAQTPGDADGADAWAPGRCRHDPGGGARPAAGPPPAPHSAGLRRRLPCLGSPGAPQRSGQDPRALSGQPLGHRSLHGQEESGASQPAPTGGRAPARSEGPAAAAESGSAQDPPAEGSAGQEPRPPSTSSPGGCWCTCCRSDAPRREDSASRLTCPRGGAAPRRGPTGCEPWLRCVPDPAGPPAV